jgi:prepilin-type N-terminal cleavage/methylation domain-containing protein
MMYASSQKKGFTLVEVLVATALFTVVMVVAVSALLVILDANRKAQNISNTINNTFFSFETMTRLLRTGSGYHCGTSGVITTPQDCAQGGTDIYFTDDRGQFVHVWYDTTSATGSIMEEVDSTNKNGTAFDAAYPLTTDDFAVQQLLFTVTGSQPVSSGDRAQPQTTIVLYGSTNKNGRGSSDLQLESTVTQRILDI